uniref:Radical SAM superfamily enzyme YgiQ, UPF0313 family n=1 Tax=Candidatus Kentrum sp. LFY TaxID=2126342 RepID=A0A450WWW7_9GAMM|nr:MAG: Radical SAM superfamily enzyme YgiQ, UPF0313 family [Candidatus Kentron sp. LFY]
MSILFLFPPFSESAYHGPHLAIPLLRSVLLKQGFQSFFIDMNIRMVKSLLSHETLEEIINLIPEANLRKESRIKVEAALTHALDTDLTDLMNGGSVALKTVLKYIRNIVFPAPDNIEECFEDELERSDVAQRIYHSFVDDVKAANPSHICISVAFGEQLAESVELVKLLKLALPDVIFVIGGSQINLLDNKQQDALQSANLFDYISIGNGEQTIVDIIKSSAKLSSNSQIVRSETMVSPDIDSLPSPIFDNLDEYIRPMSIPVLVTKGCYWGKCSFCDYPRLSNLGGKRYIARSTSTVLKEIIEVQNEISPDNINLISDAIPPAWYKELADKAIKNNIKLNTWSYMMHHSHLDYEYYERLSKAGVKSINFGTESLIDRLLAIINKQARYNDIKKNLKDAKKAGIITVSNVIPDYPSTTIKEGIENAAKFQDLLPHIDSLNPQMFDLTAGTPIHDNPSLYGISVNTDAYTKTNHGFHSLVYESTSELKETDRKILERCFAKLKWIAAIERRKRLYGDIQVSDEDIVIFDGSAIFIGDEGNKIWLMSIGYEWCLQDWEKSILEKVFKKRRECSIGNLKKHYVEKYPYQDYDSFDAWLLSLVDEGLVVTRRQNSQSRDITRDSIKNYFYR